MPSETDDGELQQIVNQLEHVAHEKNVELHDLLKLSVPKRTDRKTGEVTEWKDVIDRQKTVTYLADLYCTVSTGGDIWLYEDGAYRRDQGEIHSIITKIARGLGLQTQRSDDGEITNMLLGTNHFVNPPFNYKIGVMPFRNGYIIIDFETGKIDGPFQHTPENRFTYVLPADYDPSAPTEPVMDILHQWVEKEDVDLLIQIPAQGFIQAMLDDTFKKSYLLQGERDSGKSTYLELIYRSIGKESGALSLVSLHAISSNRFSLASLENKIINAYDDLESEELVGFGQFKKLTGSTYHEIERKNRDARNGRIFCVHVFACNIPPMVPERVKYDLAFWGRWEFVRFPFTHPIDPTFHSRTFTDEFLSGWYNLIIKSMIQIFQTKRLVVKSTEEEVMERWFQNSDPLCQFIDEMTTDVDYNGKPITKFNKFSKDLFYKFYVEFCKEHQLDERKIIRTKEKFTRELYKYGFLPKRERISIKEGKKVKRTGLVWCYVANRTWNDGMAQVEPSLPQLEGVGGDDDGL